MAEADQDVQDTTGLTGNAYNCRKEIQEENMNRILAAVVILLASLTTVGCKTTEHYDGSYPNVGTGEILVPMIKWGF